MVKKFLLFGLLVTIGFLSCKKQEKEDNTKFAVSLSQNGNTSVRLSWSAVTLSNFKNIQVYRSTSPIPDPAFGTSINQSLLVQTINDKTVTSFTDSSFIIGANGTIYYKVVLNFGNRFIVSDQLTAAFNAFALTIATNTNGSQFYITKFPEVNKLYIINYSQATMSVVDYSQRKVLATINFTGTATVVPVMNMGNPELFVFNSGILYCYNGNDLSLKYSMAVVVNVDDWTVKNNHLYVLTSAYSIRTYDLATKGLINEKYISINPWSGNSMRLFSGSHSNTLFLRYYAEDYNNGYYYVTKMNTYNLINDLPVDSLPVSNAVINADTSQNSYNYVNVNLSPEGKYIECDQNGNIYSIYDHAVHSIRTSNNFAVNPSFSSDGKYLVGRPINNATNMIDIFSLPGFNLVTSLKSPNPISFNSGSPTDDFTDNDTLVSYNVTQSGQFNQVISTLTVFFKKLN